MSKVVCALVLAICPVVACAQVRAPRECGLAADMALTAHALAAHAVERGTAERVMGAIYALALGSPEGERWRGIMERVMRAAASGTAQRITSLAYAEGVGNACMLTGGNLDAMLGADT